MGANAIFNLLRRDDVLLLAEGLSAFNVVVPDSLSGKTLGQTTIRESTGCNVIAIKTDAGLIANPTSDTQLSLGAQMILIGSADAEKQFTMRYLAT
jgi:K+/H+ antiporter YhaU regulatory subunit KhtT